MKTLTQLRDTVQPLDWHALFTPESTVDGEIAAIFDKYFSQFAACDLDRPMCIRCDAALYGLFGSFTYGLAHGEGFCSRCKYPARANHYDVGPIKRWTFVLQYHPSLLKAKPESAVSEESEVKP